MSSRCVPALPPRDAQHQRQRPTALRVPLTAGATLLTPARLTAGAHSLLNRSVADIFADNNGNSALEDREFVGVHHHHVDVHSVS